mmetsp:Transcript_18563/g.49856  ORF Transcript_18563/g.49856 Transcript_18563/m.49856 type:complete len:87 (-) Transcript_18563:387-647(-)
MMMMMRLVTREFQGKVAFRNVQHICTACVTKNPLTLPRTLPKHTWSKMNRERESQAEWWLRQRQWTYVSICPGSALHKCQHSSLAF